MIRLFSDFIRHLFLYLIKCSIIMFLLLSSQKNIFIEENEHPQISSQQLYLQSQL